MHACMNEESNLIWPNTERASVGALTQLVWSTVLLASLEHPKHKLACYLYSACQFQSIGIAVHQQKIAKHTQAAEGVCL